MVVGQVDHSLEVNRMLPLSSLIPNMMVPTGSTTHRIITCSGSVVGFAQANRPSHRWLWCASSQLSPSHCFSQRKPPIFHSLGWSGRESETSWRGRAVRRHNIGRGNFRIGLPGGGYVTIAVPNRASPERRAKVEARSSSICKVSRQLYGMKAIAHSAG